MKKSLLFIALLTICNLNAQLFECIGDETAGIGTAGPYLCNGYDLMAQITLTEFDAALDLGPATPPSTGSDSWGWTDPASGREFAIMSFTEGFAFVEITDPENPVITASVPITSTDVQRLWRDVKVYNNHAFMVGEDSDQGMKVFNLNRLLTVTNPPEIFEPDTFFQGFGSAHNIAINEDSGYAYPIGAREFGGSGQVNGGGPIFINIQDPVNPVIEGGYDSTDDMVNSYTHDAQVVIYDGPDTDYTGQEIYMGANESTMIIADITDKSNPQYISDISYASATYTHQGWFSKDKRYFLMGDELDEIMNGLPTRIAVYNVEDLDNPFVHFIWEGPTTATDHNMYIIDDTLYLANYAAGMRVLDISDIDNMNFVEIGFFDTLPGNDVAGTASAWNVYPYFPSGNLIISDVAEGLFIVKKTENLSVEDINKTNVTMFPNPAKNTTNITVDGNVIQSIKVSDVLGKEIFMVSSLNSDTFTLNTSNFQTGVYLITINDNVTKKLIIE